ncbi:hypothetical protein TB2_040829 [Malus domestica]|uniref:Uncharacterized protein n=1 Tax=Malus domestica TaxID=3750 RepID=A0A498JBK4_MALDO|nr:hypothetical protein DVH24_011894 [Malus domestica]
MERGNNGIPRNSSIAKFVNEDEGLVKVIQGFTLGPELIPKLSRVGRLVLYGFIALWGLKKLFTFGNKEERYSELEKEMMRRKIKARKEKEMLEPSSVEVVQAALELPLGSFKKPSLESKNKLSNGMETQENILPNLVNGDFRQNEGSDDTSSSKKLDFVEDGNNQTFSISNIEVSDDRESTNQDVTESEQNLHLPDNAPFRESRKSSNGSLQVKPRVIRSVKEAREYLSTKDDKTKLNEELRFEPVPRSDVLGRLQSAKDFGNNGSQGEFVVNNVLASVVPDETSDPPSTENSNSDSMIESSVKYEKWMEENFNEFEPIAKKIGVGFRDNYMVSRGKADQESIMSSDMTQLGSNEEDDSELEWMKDDSLREIVLQVRDNELAGRDPFHMMDAEDKDAFFKGLEKKVEKESTNLTKLHELLHSNIENLTYGAERGHLIV